MARRSLIALALIVLFLSGCASAARPNLSTSNISTGISTGAGSIPGKSAAPALAPAPAQPAVAASSSNPYASDVNPASDTTRQASGTTGAQTADRLVIREAQLQIVVADPFKALDAISKLATDMGGYVVTSNSYKVSLENGGQAPEANITLRVKAEDLDNALAAIKKLVKNPDTDVLSENVTGQDVTKDYTDLQSRLKNLQSAEAQLREIMVSATKPEDVLAVFNQLTQVREQIDVIQGQINYYQEAAALSSISVQIKAEATVKPLTVAGWQPAGVARDALQTTLNGLKTVANAAIWLVLFVLPIGLVIFIPLRLLWAGIQRLRRRSKTRAPAI